MNLNMCSRLSLSPIDIRKLNQIKGQNFLEKLAMTRRDIVAKAEFGTMADVKANLLPI